MATARRSPAELLGPLLAAAGAYERYSGRDLFTLAFALAGLPEVLRVDTAVVLLLQAGLDPALRTRAAIGERIRVAILADPAFRQVAGDVFTVGDRKRFEERYIRLLLGAPPLRRPAPAPRPKARAAPPPKGAAKAVPRP